MGLKTFPGGIHPHDFKEFSKDMPIENLPLPKKVVIPVSQHIGAPAKPIVKKGDEVLTGQKIAESGGFVSIPMHASICGKITKIARFPHPTGAMVMGIEITGNGEDKWVELVDDEKYLDLPVEEMKSRISEAGICGMGGAGFPTHVKISPPKDKPIDTIILNGVECEPYLTADYRIMMEQTDDILAGLKILLKVVNAKKGIIGIEANKPEAIKKMKALVKNEPNIKVISLKLKYPQGAENNLFMLLQSVRFPIRADFLWKSK